MMESKLFKCLIVIIGLMVVGQSLARDGENKIRIKREEIVQQGASNQDPFGFDPLIKYMERIFRIISGVFIDISKEVVSLTREFVYEPQKKNKQIYHVETFQ